MTAGLLLALAAGAALGCAVAALVAAWVPAYPRLIDALAALDERNRPPRHPTQTGELSPGWMAGTAVAGAALGALRRLPGSVRDADLDLLGLTRDRYLLNRAAAAGSYLLLGPALAATVTVAGSASHVGVAVGVPVVFSVIGALAGWSSHARRVAERAERARTELRFALVSFLQQVSLLRQGGAGVTTALTLPARLLGDGWAMRRLRDELDLAHTAGQMPWEGLRRFGERIGVTELSDLSAIAATAGQDGGAVVGTLLARAESLRDQLQADEHADAHRASARMSTPAAVQVFLIAAWVLYPAGTALLSSI